MVTASLRSPRKRNLSKPLPYAGPAVWSLTTQTKLEDPPREALTPQPTLLWGKAPLETVEFLALVHSCLLPPRTPKPTSTLMLWVVWVPQKIYCASPSGIGHKSIGHILPQPENGGEDMGVQWLPQSWQPLTKGKNAQ